MADFMCDPLFPQITFRVRTLYPEQYVSRSHPDNNVENIYLNLRNQTVWIDNVPYALKNGDTFTLYGEEALEVLRQYRQINLQEWVLDILYYGPVVCDLPTPTPIPSVTPTPLPTNTPTPTPVPNCLPLINTVSVENIDGFKIVFNGSFGYYGVGKGTYLFSNVPASHPIAFLNKNQESKVAFSGQYAQIPPTVAPDGNTYTYFYGDVILDVFDDFGVLSYADYFFGYLGGRFNLGFYSNCAVATPTPTLTLSPTPSPSPTPSMSLTPSPTVSLSPTPYPTISPTETPVPTHSQTPIPTLSPTFTPVPTNSMTPVPTNSPTPEPTVSPTETPIPTNSPTPEPTIAPTETPIPTASLTPEPTISPTETPTPTNSPTPEPTISPTETPIASPTETPTPTASETPIPTESVSPTPSPSPTPTVTQSPTPSPSESPTPTPTGSTSPTPTVTQSPTPSPSESPTPTPTGSPSPTPSMSPSPTPSPSESPTPTPSPSPSRSPTPSPSPSPSSTPAPTPAPADPTLQIWYNGSDTTKYQPSGADGTAITQWNDSSNLAHNANPSGGPGARPTVTYNSQNGLPALLLDGGDNLGVSNMNGLANIQNASIIVVAKTTQPANTQILTTAGTNSSTIDAYQLLASSNVYVLKMAGGTGTSSVATDSNVHVHTMLFDGTQATNASRLVYRVDGVQQTLNFGATTIGTNTNASITYMYFGADQTPARNLTGTLCEILIYTQTLSGSSLANTEKYLKDKWGIV